MEIDDRSRPPVDGDERPSAKLQAEFWRVMKEVAQRREQSLDDLLAEIDHKRNELKGR